MSMLEIVTRLSLKGVQWDRVGGKGAATLTEFDVAACLRGEGDVLFDFASWYVNGDGKARVKLLGYLLRETQQIAVKQNWSCAKDERKLRGICDTALTEFSSPRRCTRCKGSGIYKIKICDRCQGDGCIAYTRAVLAKLCGVSPNNWKKTWEPKYLCVINLLLEKSEKINKQLQAKIKGCDSHMTHL